jgi:dehydrogenase/reductase SDR family protein 12
MQFLRNTEYQAYGTAKYLKSGFESAKLGELENIDLKDRSFMITGANSGIGFATSHYLASRGGTVHMICRSEEKANEASRKLSELTSNSNVHVHICDVAERADIERLVKKFQDENIKLDVLVNNAGMINHEKRLNSDGVELTFATNLLSNFLLTTLLIPLLLKSNDPRVIFVSSGDGLTQKLMVDPEFSSFKEWDGATAYAMTKRQQIALCEKFSLVYKDTPIKFFSMHPGWVDTPQVQKGFPDFHKTHQNSLRTPEQGADTICWLCVTPNLDKSSSGEFFRDRQPEYKHLPLSRTQYTNTEVDNLWKTCVKLTGVDEIRG